MNPDGGKSSSLAGSDLILMSELEVEVTAGSGGRDRDWVGAGGSDFRRLRTDFDGFGGRPFIVVHPDVLAKSKCARLISCSYENIK